MTSREIAAVALVVGGAAALTASAGLAMGTTGALAAAGLLAVGGGVLLGLGSPPPVLAPGPYA